MTYYSQSDSPPASKYWTGKEKFRKFSEIVAIHQRGGIVVPDIFLYWPLYSLKEKEAKKKPRMSRIYANEKQNIRKVHANEKSFTEKTVVIYKNPFAFIRIIRSHIETYYNTRTSNEHSRYRVDF